ncbi:MAG TPA: YiaA/YiaB family inner membrane protein [Acidimicrobiales bacterium]|nr:YiaA/YiaB family inner membrane protein [Acidimicrobiales bacterium]
MANISINQKPTSAFYAQAAISFAVAGAGLLLGIAYLPVSAWTRAFLAFGALYTVTSAFTLAKCVRDQHEANTVVHRVDEARLEKFLQEHDPFNTVV